MDYTFNNLVALNLLWVLPAVVGLYVYASLRRSRALKAFAEAGLLERISLNVSRPRRAWKATLVTLALASLIVGLARPAWNPRPERVERFGRDIVFLLDASRSMLAEDLKPNRLQRAKLLILDVVDRLQGDRVGLIAFAGNAVVKCPLTLDYGFFRMMLDQVGPDSVTRGGTLVGDAVRKALAELFDDRVKDYKDIIVLTDGEDHDSFPVEAAREADRRGVRIIAVGLGDDRRGARIPITRKDGSRGFLEYEGREVWSKLGAHALRKMVNVARGGYVQVTPGATCDLAAEYKKIARGSARRKVESRTVKRYQEKFQIFMGFALVLLCVESLTRERKREAKT